jgi:Putative transposase/Transposase zinc-binding domain
VQGSRLEVADIFRHHFEAFRHRYAPTPSCERVARDVMRCRTAALGGHLEVCTACGFARPAYNSCRNRHCPKCQALRQARWVQQRMTRILPAHYFHVVFTVPSKLHGLVRLNRARLYDLLIKSAATTLDTLARDPKWITHSAQPAITCVLHTWTRELQSHPHVHCIVSGGGLSLDGARWIAAPPTFLFPVHVLGSLFRGKFLAGLAALQARGHLRDPDHARAARRRRRRLHDTRWVVYAKRPFGGPEQVYRYLGRYTHRVAISNTRLLSADPARVVFRTRGHATASCHPVEFIRRFLDHVLPKRFVKIRHFGLVAPVNVNTRLAHARRLLTATAAGLPRHLPATPPSTASIAALPFAALLLALTGIDLDRCPNCRQRTIVRRPLPIDCRGPPRYPAPP